MTAEKTQLKKYLVNLEKSQVKQYRMRDVTLENI